MRRRAIVLFVSLALAIAACGGSTTAPTDTSSTSTSPAEPPTSATAGSGSTAPVSDEPITALPDAPVATPIGLATEAGSPRPHHIKSFVEPEYVYRAYLQNPSGAAWGPDDAFYVADGLGHQIVRVDPSGDLSNLGFWVNVEFEEGAAGPHSVAFDSAGNVYAAHQTVLARQLTDGTVETLIGQSTLGPIGGIGGLAIGPDDSVYVSTHDGGLFRVDGATPTEIGQFDSLGRIRFSPQGELFGYEPATSSIVWIDPTSGESSVELTVDPTWFGGAYFEIGPDGDVFVFGDSHEIAWFDASGSEVTRFAPGGPSGGIAFDGNGSLWAVTYFGDVVRYEFKGGSVSSELVHQGFYPADIAVTTDGTVYATLVGFTAHSESRLVRVTPDGSSDVLARDIAPGIASVAVLEDGTILIGSVEGVFRVGPEGRLELIAEVPATRMITGHDGAAWVFAGDLGADKSIRRVTTSTVTVITDIAGGVPLGNGEGNISRFGDGQYMISAHEVLYTLDSDGGTAEFADIDALTTAEEEILFGLTGGGPMAATPAGDVFVFPDVGRSKGVTFRLGIDRPNEAYAINSKGDAQGMTTSPDGEWLYIGEAGSISRLPIVTAPETVTTTTTLGDADDITDAATTAICDAYLEFAASRSPEAREAPLYEILANLGDGAPPTLTDTIETLATADYGSTDVRPLIGELQAYVLPLCNDRYTAHLVGAPDLETAAQIFFDALIAGDREAALTVASEAVVSAVDAWNGYPQEGEFPRLTITEDGFWAELNSGWAIGCSIEEGVVTGCRF